MQTISYFYVALFFRNEICGVIFFARSLKAIKCVMTANYFFGAHTVVLKRKWIFILKFLFVFQLIFFCVRFQFSQFKQWLQFKKKLFEEDETIRSIWSLGNANYFAGPRVRGQIEVTCNSDTEHSSILRVWAFRAVISIHSESESLICLRNKNEMKFRYRTIHLFILLPKWKVRSYK